MALKPEQYVAIEWLAQVKNGGKTLEEVAAEAGVSRKCLWQWRRDDEFQQELRREMVRHTMNRMPEVMAAMVDSAVTLKSAAAAKLLMQANDMIVDQVRIERKISEQDSVDIEGLKARLDALRKREA
ncbi:Uncharacterized protein BN871_EV_00270 [Paenibacillus sp. P22]|nr:Uncharacterized protein BN871_EV_00270 [Paenibacillus sp. P22]